MDALWLSTRLLFLLAVANGAPILAKRVFGTWWSTPLDGGWTFVDGRRLLGPSKTVRGFVIATAGAAVAAELLGLSFGVGALVGAFSMLGDALASFVKRRLNMASSDRATGLDQIPEALLPLLVVASGLGLSLLDVLLITLVFFVLEMPLARLFFALRLRDRPY
jgi:CDP-2,3-bis-(O-geranylgeranyl)-sn-glycerol synthase